MQCSNSIRLTEHAYPRYLRLVLPVRPVPWWGLFASLDLFGRVHLHLASPWVCVSNCQVGFS